MQIVYSLAAAYQSPITITATTGSPGLTIPSDFPGLSYEINSGGLLGGFLNGNATSLAGVVSLLGSSGWLRFGGNEPNTAPNLTQANVNDLRDFLGLLGGGWKVLYGLNLLSNDVSTATSQAQMLANTLGSANVVFQAGNEPIDGAVPDFTVQSFATAYNNYYSNVKAALPSSVWAAYDDADFGQSWNVLSRLTPAPSSLKWLTQHFYAYEASDPPSLVTPPQVLARPFTHSASYISAGNAPTPAALFGFNTPWLAANSLTCRLSETNMMSSGGLDGMTNALANSAWMIGMQMALARSGGAGINAHGQLSSAGLYDPIYIVSSGVYKPAPVFYGMYLFSKLVGQRILPVIYSGVPSDVDVMATKDGGGVFRMLVVNGNPTASRTFKPALDIVWTSATVLKLDGTGFGDKNPTLGGAVIGNGGSWSGSTTTIANGGTVTLCPCGAALLTFS